MLTSRQFAEGVIDTVELLTSEVVTNAIVHGRSGPELALELGGKQVRVAVVDTSPDLPVRRAARPDDVSGRGMLIIESLARAWGVTVESDGSKRVWFEVAC